jgi:mercuric ion binding protein
MPGSPLKLLGVAALLCAASISAGETKQVTLDVPGMNCVLCPATVKKALQRMPGHVDAKVDLDTKRAVVRYDAAQTAPHALARAVTDAGYPATVVSE